MGGFHVKYRKSNAKCMGISSQLTLPANLEGDSTIEVYPEFFHGFYDGKYGMDTGIFYKNGEFKMFSFCNSDTHVEGGNSWQESSFNSGYKLAKGSVVTINSYYKNKTIVSEYIQGVNKIGTLITKLSIKADMIFSKGAVINREMTIGANTNKYAPSKAFFSDAKFSNSTLTTPSWTYVAMNDSTSTDQNPFNDGDLPIPAGFRYGGKTIKEGNFITHIGNADCRKK